jgi:uncharacterized protein YprB with RNaseH-like and TPR domain
MTLRRDIACDAFSFPRKMPEAAGLVMPGIATITVYEDLLFFDLETTGLSGGAGTVAFLAAFGRLVFCSSTGTETADYKLCITQYLLLDYPGENDFVEALLGEFSPGCIVVSYNGRCFDSPLLATRCLMNGKTPPVYGHADLLYPARRLWKESLLSCSQASIETNILGIDRAGDTPGAMAPDIWFSFLRNGGAEPLLGVCDHNRRDISGLVSVFAAMINIASDPLDANRKIPFNLEALAIRWTQTMRARQCAETEIDGEANRRLRETGTKLLRHAAETGYPRAGLHYALSLIRDGKYGEGREWLFQTASGDRPPLVQAAALRSLAIDSERRMKDPAEALTLTERGLELLPADSPLREDGERRLERLQKKLGM